MRLPEFDRLPESERALYVAHWQKRRNACPDCGRPIEECSDPTRLWWSYRRICYATMEREAAEAAYADIHRERPWHDGTHTKWSDKRGPSHPYRYDMGVTTGVAPYDVTPWDSEWTTKESASPVPPVGDEGEGDAEAVEQHGQQAEP